MFRNNSLARIKNVKLDNSDQLIMLCETWMEGGILEFRIRFGKRNFIEETVYCKN